MALKSAARFLAVEPKGPLLPEANPVQEGIDEDSEVIALLRTPGLSIKYLDERSKQRIRAFIVRNHVEEGMSLGDIAKLIGNKTSGYTSWLTRQVGIQPRSFEEARLAGIHKKVRKYERKPFDGSDGEKGYLLGIRHGDLSVCVPFGDAIRVSTSSTKPAMIDLFSGLFSPFGHVYKHPREKKDMKSYEWNLSTILDNSFSFLLQDFEEARSWIEENEDRLFGYLSGFLDAEGSIITTKDRRGKVVLTVDYNNCNKVILEWIMGHAKRLGFSCCLRINKEAGERTRPYGIPVNSDYWQLSISGVDRIRELVSKLRLRHREKIERQAIALSTHKGQDYATVANRIRDLRLRIETERDLCVLEAESV